MVGKLGPASSVTKGGKLATNFPRMSSTVAKPKTKLNGIFKNSKGTWVKWVNGVATGAVKSYKPPVTKTITKPVAKPPVGFQFGAEAYANILNRLNEDRGTLAGLDSEGRDNELEYMRSLRDTDQQFDKTKLSNLNSSASRGTAFSSQYAKSTSDTANEFNRIFGDLNSKRKLFLTNDLSQRNLVGNGYNDYLRGLALQEAQKNALQGKPKGVRFSDPKLGNTLSQSFKTPENDSFLTKLRQKYGI